MKTEIFIPAALALFCSVNAYAGLFSSLEDFKCGRDDAVKALQQSIKDSASAMIQSDALKKSAILLNKPADVYVNKLGAMTIDVKNVSTTGNTSESKLTCEAQVSVPFTAEALDVIHAIPDRISDVQFSQTKLYNNTVVWKNYQYSLKLSDNQKDISVIDDMSNAASTALYGITLLSVNKNEIIKANDNAKVSAAKAEYDDADAYLNETWKAMPASARSSLKSVQLAWVKDKTTKCGKISDAMAETTDAARRMNIFTCQAKMTNERVTFLGGDN